MGQTEIPIDTLKDEFSRFSHYSISKLFREVPTFKVKSPTVSTDDCAKMFHSFLKSRGIAVETEPYDIRPDAKSDADKVIKIGQGFFVRRDQHSGSVSIQFPDNIYEPNS